MELVTTRLLLLMLMLMMMMLMLMMMLMMLMLMMMLMMMSFDSHPTTARAQVTTSAVVITFTEAMNTLTSAAGIVITGGLISLGPLK